jgi:ribonuclease PH
MGLVAAGRYDKLRGMANTPSSTTRRANQLRPVKITTDFVRTADGSCLVEMGNTRVICTASFAPGVPAWREASGQGWLTAEYGMLPASTGRRKSRPIAKPDSRGVEIQRIIGRVLRNVVNFEKLGPNTVYLDCDVLEADGGTRTAAINGAWVALALATHRAWGQGLCGRGAVEGPVGAVSVGVVAGQCVLDLDYQLDSTAEVDMNVAMLPGGQFAEIQGSAERQTFDRRQLDRMLSLAAAGITRIHRLQRQAFREAKGA